MHLLEDSAAGIAAVIQSVEPLLESARLESVLAGKLGSGQVAGVEKLDELSALRGGVIRATSRSMIIHPQSLSPRTHLREDLLGLTLTFDERWETANRFEGYCWGISDVAAIAPNTAGKPNSANLTYTFVPTGDPHATPFSLAERAFYIGSTIPELVACDEIR